MWNINGGYIGASMSVRAAEAYEDGEKPMSKWTKKAIIEAIGEFLVFEALEDSLKASDFNKLTSQELKENFLIYSSWHHTSKYFNQTYFYSINEDAILNTTKESIEEIIKNRKPKPKTKKKVEAPVERRVKAEYREQVSARRSKKVTSYGTIKGNWFYSDDGSKKSTKGKYFEILCEEKDFGVKYLVKGEFEKDKNVIIQIEEKTYNKRKVKSDEKGLYVLINANKIYKDECMERRT